MADFLQIYIQNINKNFSNIQNKFQQCQMSSSEKVKTLLNDIELIIKDTEKTLKNLEVEINMSFKPEKYKKDISEFKSSLKKFKLKLKDKQDEIRLEIKLDGEGSDEKLLEQKSQEVAYNSYEKLQHATRATVEIENVTGNILGDLSDQTQQMKDVNTKIHNVNDEITQSSSLISEMIKIHGKNKVILVSYSAFLGLIFLSTLIYKLIKKFND